jgi:acetylcholinesterase
VPGECFRHEFITTISTFNFTVIDGDFLLESVGTSLKQGNFKRTQLLAGSNMDEAIYFIVYQLAVKLTVEKHQFKLYLQF